MWGMGETWVPAGSSVLELSSVEDSERRLWEAMDGLEHGRVDYTCPEDGVKETAEELVRRLQQWPNPRVLRRAGVYSGG